MRDSQKSRVYAWENSVAKVYTETLSLEECETLVAKIWLAERARYATNGRRPPPRIRAKRGPGARDGAVAFHWEHELAFGRASRNEWVCAHEVSHLLAHRHEGHSARFVAILIGVAARHLGYDADALVGSATEQGVRVDLRSLGPLPERSRVEQLYQLLPCTVMWGATQLDVSYRVIRGLALQLIRQRRARYFRGKIVPTS